MKKYTTLLALILITSFSFAQVSKNEKAALLDLYASTDGINWNTNWDVNTPVKDWHGVTISDDKVIAINLMFNNLKGELPASISSLVHLENLELSFNQIDGSLPSSLGNLKSLKSLAINSNQITGTIPADLGNLKNLEELHLSSNSLSGTIPASLGSLNNLETFNIFDNSITGTLPYGLTESKNLKKLVVAENEIIITNAIAETRVFKVDNENTRFKTPRTFINKTVLAIETSDDE